jgi:hypothetical protein
MNSVFYAMVRDALLSDEVFTQLQVLGSPRYDTVRLNSIFQPLTPFSVSHLVQPLLCVPGSVNLCSTSTLMAPTPCSQMVFHCSDSQKIPLRRTVQSP